MRVTLPSKTEIYVLTLPYFLATKLEAYSDRGQNDPRTSRDIEDVVSVLDGHLEIEKTLSAIEGELATYLKKEFQKLSKDEYFSDALRAHLPYGPDREMRANRLSNILNTFITN